MIAFKCKMCGGVVNYEQGATIGECENCGTQQTLPRVGDDRRANLYDRAGHFRRNNEFDKAIALYEQILNEDKTDAEAYWSLVLCKYGIEYVEDPLTHKRVPTMNRTQYTSVFADEDYKEAIKYADSLQRSIYESDAKTIDDIQKGILAISSREEPFDIFICYKETDQNGRRTVDSVLANDIYTYLTREGFKVFFSRITLEDKLGTAYEPYIFAALNSAKVMIALGTRAEYFTSPWVKNEWSRYLAIVSKNHEKRLIPAYRDMDPYDMPEEFSHLQALDMGKLGFMQDLVTVINRSFQGGRTVNHSTSSRYTQVQFATETKPSKQEANLRALLKRAELYLEDGEYERADQYYERVLAEDGNNAEAFLGKMMISLRVKTREDLVNCESPIESNEYYIKILEVGSPSFVAKIREYAATIRENIEIRGKDAILASVTAGLEKGYSKVTSDIVNEDKLREVTEWTRSAKSVLDNIRGYKNSEELLSRINQLVMLIRNKRMQSQYEKAAGLMSKRTISGYCSAVRILDPIRNWKNSEELIEECNREIAIRHEKEKKRVKARRIITGIILTIFTITCIGAYQGDDSVAHTFLVIVCDILVVLRMVSKKRISERLYTTGVGPSESEIKSNNIMLLFIIILGLVVIMSLGGNSQTLPTK